MDELMNKCVDVHIETFAGDKNTEELINEVKIKLPQDEEQYKLVEVVGTMFSETLKFVVFFKFFFRFSELRRHLLRWGLF